MAKRERRTWTEKDIENGINEVRHACLLDRMPSRTEVETLYGDTSLSNAIMKNGGYYHWAQKLGLKIKSSDSALGFIFENKVKRILDSQGYQCDLTNTRCPYDLLVNGCVKIDVKAARKTKIRGSDCYSFRLAKSQQTCDVYVAVCLDDNKQPQKFYVIPAHVMSGKVQLCIGAKSSRYDQYIDRWDVIEKFVNAFQNVS